MIHLRFKLFHPIVFAFLEPQSSQSIQRYRRIAVPAVPGSPNPRRWGKRLRSDAGAASWRALNLPFLTFLGSDLKVYIYICISLYIYML